MSENKAVAVAKAIGGNLTQTGQHLIDAVLDLGINGKGPFKSAEAIAQECLSHAENDIEQAIKRVIATHTRLVGISGAANGLGGFAAMPFTVPTDITVFYSQAARMVATIAILRGYDANSDEVKSMVAVSLIGVVGTEALAKAGVEIAGKAGVAALKKLPGSVLIKINKAVGFRLLTKFGEKGVVNLVKVIPVVASGVGASLNIAGMKTIAGYAKSNFPAVKAAKSK